MLNRWFAHGWNMSSGCSWPLGWLWWRVSVLFFGVLLGFEATRFLVGLNGMPGALVDRTVMVCLLVWVGCCLKTV